MKHLLTAALLGLLAACTPETEPKGDTDSTDTQDTQTDTQDTVIDDTSDTNETGDTIDTNDTDDTSDTEDTVDTSDTGPEVPLDGFGEISGECGILEEAMLSDDISRLFENSIDFGELEFDYDALSEGGQEVYDDGNLGGSSLHSEIFAYEMLYRCELAALLKTEGEIEYEVEGSKTDILVEIQGHRVGVSVTRAYGWPPEDPYTMEDAQEILDDKLRGILSSSENVSEADAWEKQILSVIAYTSDHADSIREAWEAMEETIRADTIVITTITEGNDEFIY